MCSSDLDRQAERQTGRQRDRQADRDRQAGTDAGSAGVVRGVSSVAVTTEGADSVDTLSVLTQVWHHLALINVWGGWGRS